MSVRSCKSVIGRRVAAAAGCVACLLLLTAPCVAATVADSLADWPGDGSQGTLGWYNGYYNLTLDADGTYQADDFIEFEPDYWSGTQWDLETGAVGPWTEIGPENGHPNGTNSAPNEEHWGIRRWVADSVTTPTDLTLTWSLRKTNLNCCGTGGRLFLNGNELDWWIIEGTDGTGVTRSIRETINPGDIIDLALTPENPDGSRGDGSDGSAFKLIVETDIRPDPEPHPDVPTPPANPIADSVVEFSGSAGSEQLVLWLLRRARRPGQWRWRVRRGGSRSCSSTMAAMLSRTTRRSAAGKTVRTTGMEVGGTC